MNKTLKDSVHSLVAEYGSTSIIEEIVHVVDENESQEQLIKHKYTEQVLLRLRSVTKSRIELMAKANNTSQNSILVDLIDDGLYLHWIDTVTQLYNDTVSKLILSGVTPRDADEQVKDILQTNLPESNYIAFTHALDASEAIDRVKVAVKSDIGLESSVALVELTLYDLLHQL